VTYVDTNGVKMFHAKSLRIIGQSLEVAKVGVFALETDGPNYILRSGSLTETAEWILRHALSPNDTSGQSARPSAANRPVRFTPADILRLDEQAQRQRRNDLYPNPQGFSRLSQLLRALGDHLDQTKVSTFQISWTHDSVSVVFESVDTQSDSRTFSTEKLQELGSHLRFRRSSRSRFDSNSPDSLNQIKPRNR
jgi:hypothetical protein